MIVAEEAYPVIIPAAASTEGFAFVWHQINLLCPNKTIPTNHFIHACSHIPGAPSQLTDHPGPFDLPSLPPIAPLGLLFCLFF